MKILDYLPREVIEADLKAETKVDALKELVQVLVRNNQVKNADKALEVLLEREKLGSTGVGDGVAIPHAKFNEVKNLVAVFGRCQKGIDFESLDNKPAHLFFLFLAPESAAALHLKILARISRFLKKPDFRQSLMHAKDRDDIYQIISEEERDMTG
ncbi:MAG: PTS sugar transporter subunit IIA [Thermoplasmata archaeon]|nr:MAG: PTS sugar transporter subunit IIA [Thermoplasmata archaeon]